MELPQETDAGGGTLPGKPQPHGNTQINENGLVQDLGVIQKYA